MNMEAQTRQRQHQHQQEQEQEQHPYATLYEPLMVIKTEPAEADDCPSSSSSSRQQQHQQQQQQQQQQRPEKTSSSSAVANQSPASPPQSRIITPVTYDRAKKRQKLYYSDETNNDNSNARINLNEQIAHILNTFLDDDDDDTTDVDVGVGGSNDRINDADSFDSNDIDIERMKLGTNNSKKVYSKPHAPTTATATATTARGIGENLDGNRTDSGIAATATESTIKLHDARWVEMYQQLVAYKKKHNGDTRVPFRYEENPQLGRWVSNQRRHYRNKRMAEEHKRLFNSIGFEWEGKISWEALYERLVAYKKEHNDTNVPQRFNEDPLLGTWVANQRKAYRNNSITEERKCLLTLIGFVWASFGARWMEMYQRLVAYKKKYNDTRVLKHYSKDPELVAWVRCQRHTYNKNKMAEGRKRLLNKIDFVWVAKNSPLAD